MNVGTITVALLEGLQHTMEQFVIMFSISLEMSISLLLCPLHEDVKNTTKALTKCWQLLVKTLYFLVHESVN